MHLDSNLMCTSYYIVDYKAVLIENATVNGATHATLL